MENDAVRDAIQYLEKQKAAIEEALMHLTIAEGPGYIKNVWPSVGIQNGPEDTPPEDLPAEPGVPEPEPVEDRKFKFSVETRRRMSIAHRHRWDLKRKMAAIERELRPNYRKAG
jgi:hypothetical protein